MAWFTSMRSAPAEGGVSRARHLVLGVLLSTLAGLAVTSLAPREAAAQELEFRVSCRAERPVKPGQEMVWKAEVRDVSGSVTYSWSGDEGLTGDAARTTKKYSSVGLKSATVTVTEDGIRHQTTCYMHVIPGSKPPSLTPVLWVPKGVDPRPMVPQLERVWRSIRADFFHLYGNTFKLQPLKTVVSTRTEQQICGGDCTDLGLADRLVYTAAFPEASDAVGGVIPYERAIQVMVWRAGGWAGSYGWDRPLGATGDRSVGAAAGVQIPPIEPDTDAEFAAQLGSYRRTSDPRPWWSGVSAIAHEANHAIGWDDPHDFSLDTPPNDLEKQIALAGPFLTETLRDRTVPRVKVTSPSGSRPLSGVVEVKVNATDKGGVDAVVLTVDNQLWAIDTSPPYSLKFDTRRVGFGRHQLEVFAYDRTGNNASVVRDVVVRNQLRAKKCPQDYPVDTFHACFFEGVRLRGRFLGALDDHPFPVATSNAGWGLKHDVWGNEEIAFGQRDTVSGVWTGTLDFPRANYILQGDADDGVRLYINGRRVVNNWQNPGPYSVVVRLAGRTRVRVEWFDDDGAQALTLRWRPTRESPTDGREPRQRRDRSEREVVVPEGVTP